VESTDLAKSPAAPARTASAHARADNERGPSPTASREAADAARSPTAGRETANAARSVARAPLGWPRKSPGAPARSTSASVWPGGSGVTAASRVWDGERGAPPTASR